ncbi:MAG: hypothetical protein AB8B73_10315 [Ekhidna sp.]
MKVLVRDLVNLKPNSLVVTNNLSLRSATRINNPNSINDINSMEYSYKQKPISIIVDEMHDSNKDKFFLLSDLQGSQPDDFSLIRSDTSNNYHIIKEDIRNLKNAFIDSVYLTKKIDDFESLLLNIDVGSSSNFSEGNIVIKLLKEGKQISSVIHLVQDVESVQFNIPQYKRGDYEITISGDDVEYDNSFYLSIESFKKPNISLISDGENDYLAKVFEKNSLFNLSMMTSSSIDFSVLEGSDMIVIDDLADIPNGVLNQISKSTVVVFPSLTDSNILLNSALGLNITYSADQNRYSTIFDTDHDLFNGVFEVSESNGASPNGSSVYDFVGIFESVMKLSNGKTFLAKASKNNFYIFSCPLNEEFTNLPVHGIFLPLMYELANGSIRDQDFKISYYPEEIISVNGSKGDVPIRLVGQGYETIPEFYHVENNINVKIPSSISPGFYSFIQNKDTLINVSINISKFESSMEGMELSELEQYFGGVDHVQLHKLNDTTSIANLTGETESGLWKIALILVLFFVLFETMLHRYLK